MRTIHHSIAPLGLVWYSPDKLRCLTAPARVVTALRAYCINRITRPRRPEHNRDKYMQPQLSIFFAPGLTQFRVVPALPMSLPHVLGKGRGGHNMNPCSIVIRAP